MEAVTAYEELHLAAEARGFRVFLELVSDERPTRLSRLAVVDRDRVEVVALPIREERALEGTAAVLVEYLAATSERPA